MSGTPSRFQIDQVEAALVAVLAAGMPAGYAAALGEDTPHGVDVDTIGDHDFNDKGDLVLRPPAIRVQFDLAKYDTLRDNQRLTYEAGLVFEVLCFEESLRSKKDQRRQSLVLTAVAQDQLAGARLALSDGTNSGPITVNSVSLQIPETGPVNQLYAITITVPGIAQFSGANSRFGS